MEKHIVGEEEEGGVNGHGTEEEDVELELADLLTGSKLSPSRDHLSKYSNARRWARSPPRTRRSFCTEAACVRCRGAAGARPLSSRRPTCLLLPILLALVAFVVSSSSISFLITGRSNGVGAGVSPLIDVPNHRRNVLDPKGEFSFVHISKAAGASWIRSFKELPLDVCPRRPVGLEFSVWFQTHYRARQQQSKGAGGCEGADHYMLSLRSPRHHMWSMFTECKHDGWRHKVTKGTGFPRSGISPEEDVRDFEAWLDHFLPMDNNHIDSYQCYHPANFQSRHLDAKLYSPHLLMDMPDDEYRFEPNLDHSLATYWNQDFVPVVELFHESSCLLYYRLGPEAPPKAIRYLEQKCRCPQPLVEDETLRTTHVTHHELGHRGDLRHLPDSILSKIETLTRVDRELYLVALKELLEEFSWLESPAALGRRVLCEDALDKWEPELAYLGVSLRAVYKKATERTR